MDKHFIVLNGKRYDAVTGALLGEHSEPQVTKSQGKAETKPQASKQSRLSDIRAKENTVNKSIAPSRTRHKSTPVKAHKPQSSQTLMRRVVKRPTGSPKTPIKQHYPLATKTPSGIKLGVPKRPVAHVDPMRLHRAKNITQSSHVGRFQARAARPIQATIAPVAVAEPPANLNTQPSPDQTKQSAKKPAKTNIFEQALADAKSHKATPKSRRARRWLSASAAVASVLVIGGFVAFLSRSAIELQVASVQAGFAATMPAYAPEGFSKQSLNASSGQVTISFAAPNDQFYTITQQQSKWDSQTLFDSLVAEQGNSYQVVQNNGRNIYIYGDSQAAWVDGGVLYKVNGNARLSSDQLISIASSI